MYSCVSMELSIVIGFVDELCLEASFPAQSLMLAWFPMRVSVTASLG